MRESEAIATVLRMVPAADVLRGPGDDAAVLAAPEGNLVWATDLVIEGRHFRREWSSLADAAYRAVARNASDLAAMGADPIAFLAAVALPDAEPETVAAIGDGFRDAARDFGLPIIGGDLSRDDHVVFAVSVLGRVNGAGLGRDGAQPGDVVAVTGRLGACAAALALLREGGPTHPMLQRHPALLARHRRGVARLDAGRAVRGCAHAAIDLSDGLAIDASRVAEASGVELVIDPALVPIDDGVADAAAALRVDVETFTIAAGDDYELLVCMQRSDLETIRAAVAPLEVTVIGEVRAGEPRVVTPAGSVIEGGHDHFA